jgi:ribose transport system ATP-binding protein
VAGKIPKKVIQKGITMVPEERRTQGLFSKLPLRENVIMMNSRDLARLGVTNKSKETNIASKYVKKLNIVARNLEQIVSSLSGGNQQKVVVAKCLSSNSDIILMDEPTRGIDVGAKNEVHNIIRDLSNEGKSIIIFSSELPEIVNLCDRVILLYEGRMIKEFKNNEIDSNEVMQLVTGGIKVGNKAKKHQ